MIRIATIAALAIATLAPAAAEWPNDQLTYRGYKRDLYWSRYHCGGRYRPEGCESWRWRRYYARRAPVNHDGIVCHSVVPAVGEQAQSEGAAWEAAIVAWRGRVRWLYGERFTNDATARDTVKACAPSSVPDAYRDAKLPALYRCEMQARPCRPVPRKIDRDGDD